MTMLSIDRDVLKVVMCDCLMAINAEAPEYPPIIPPTAIDWIGDYLVAAVLARTIPQPTERQGDEGVVTVDELLDRLDEIGFPVVGIEPCSIPIGYWTDDAECGWSVSIMGPEVSTPSGRENDGEMFEERTLLSALTLAVEWVDERQGGGS